MKIKAIASNKTSMLTDTMRQWLRSPEHATLTTWDCLGEFLKEFKLSPEQAGQCIAQWIRETITKETANSYRQSAINPPL